MVLLWCWDVRVGSLLRLKTGKIISFTCELNVTGCNHGILPRFTVLKQMQKAERYANKCEVEVVENICDFKL